MPAAARRFSAPPRPPPRYVWCPGNNQPGTAPFHGLPTVLEKLWDRNGKPYAFCRVCGCRLFLPGSMWHNYGLTRDQMLAVCPQAVDGAGVPLASMT